LSKYFSIPAGYQIRRAAGTDADRIKALVRGENLNPLSLDWRRFFVATDRNGEVIACVQVKPHRDGTRELASLVVHEAHRRKGLAAALIHQVLQTYPGVLYLMCQARLENYYRRFGFQSVRPENLPPYFRRIAHLAGIFRVIFPPERGLLVMRREE
jgi:N-acetylglutamate synthase-like GNAT family acetyltransferase